MGKKSTMIAKAIFSRRRVLALAGVSTLTACSGIQGSNVPEVVKNIAADAALIATGLAGILPTLSSVGLSPDLISKVSGYVSDLQKAASTLAGMPSVGASATTVQQIVGLVNGVVAVLGVVTLPTGIGAIVSAASILLPILERAVGLTSSRRPVALVGMTPEQARLVLSRGVK